MRQMIESVQFFLLEYWSENINWRFDSGINRYFWCFKNYPGNKENTLKLIMFETSTFVVSIQSLMEIFEGLFYRRGHCGGIVRSPKYLFWVWFYICAWEKSLYTFVVFLYLPIRPVRILLLQHCDNVSSLEF